jgi:tyrosine-protein kinase Etk/Wzc
MMNPDNQNMVSAVLPASLMMNQPIIQPAPTVFPYEEEIEISTFLDTLSDNRWLIAKIVCSFALIGLIYALFSKPVYEATMLIHVEEDKPNTSKNILGDISSLFDVKTAAISEMELISSRLVISRAVDNLGLYIDVHPKYFPLVGRWIAAHNSGLSTPGLFGYGGYVWGKESINIPIFYVPDGLQNLDFVITIEPNNQYRISQREWNIEFRGVSGRTLSGETAKGKIELRVDRIFANPGAQFILKYKPKLTAIEDVQNSLKSTERGKLSGIVAITLEGSDPKTSSDILTEIGQEYIHQNVTRKLEEAEKSLAFLDKKLPDLKFQLEQSEAKYYKFRNAHGTIDLAEEAKLSLQQAAAAKAKRMELQQKREEMLVSFTPAHPIVVGIDKQISAMTAEINAMNEHIKQLPMMEQDLLGLNREVKVNTDLYAALLNTAQQLRLVKAGKVSNVRLIDAPMVPENPARPNHPKIMGISILLGLFIGIAAAFFKKTLGGGIDDPRKIEKMLGARVVYATIPHSRTQENLYKQSSTKSPKIPVLASCQPSDAAIESLRSFRTTLQFSMGHFRNNIVLIGSPTAGLGKSFVSVNFAAVMAASGKRVLLIDADFRNGNLHRYFGLGRKNGLSESISGAIPARLTIHRSVLENLDFLSTGNIPPNPSEFLLHPNFGALLQSVSVGYDLVLIDSPAVLAVSDTLIIGSHAGAVFILTRSGITTETEINETIKRLNHAGISPKGILFNDMKIRARNFSAYHYEKPRQLEYSHDPGSGG